ncbi:MAG TPA: diacylglycerol kinase family protein [Terriglobales bacterium]|nr:diacylglycerol kinase family protein [Terriglobales bacterium]
MRVAIINGPRAADERTRPFRQAIDAEWTDEIGPGLDAILVFGGDGTVHRHLSRLAGAMSPVLVVPTGSGNDFASSLGIHNPGDSLRLWKRFIAGQGRVHWIDLGYANSDGDEQTHIFCNVANFGLDSEINRRANELSPFWRANGGYVLSLFPALLRYRAPVIKLIADGHLIERPILLAVAANGTRYGRGLKIAPHANMEDGFLDLCFVRDTSKVKVAALFPLVYIGKHLSLKEVEYLRFRHLRIECEHALDIYADGEFLCRTPAEIRAVPNALPVIAP